MKEEKQNTEIKNNSLNNAIWVLTVAVLAIMLFNQFSIGQLSAPATGQAVSSGLTQQTVQASAGPDVIPKGVPRIYGSELGVSFDDVSAVNPSKADTTIEKLAVKDRQITLSGADLDRYIKIASQISCEYCCGAESIIFSNGQAACGCAHSYSMRGLAKYLIKNHPTEFTDDQILEEMGKWKTLYFPGALAKKASVLQQQGIELNYINLASNKYRGIESSASGGSGSMVGGC